MEKMEKIQEHKTFKVGERVMIKLWDDIDKDHCLFGFPLGMKNFCGKFATIKEFRMNTYGHIQVILENWSKIQELREDYSFSVDMLQHIGDLESYDGFEVGEIVYVDFWGTKGKAIIREIYKDKNFLVEFKEKISLGHNGKTLAKGTYSNNCLFVRLEHLHKTPKEEESIMFSTETSREGNWIKSLWFDEILKPGSVKIVVPSKEPLYTFRFNEERKSVTLYKNGEKVQFVKCHPEDKFSWKIGLGVAFYKEFFGNKPVKPEVAYIKDILNWKMFYTYMVAYALDFNKDKMQRLDARVKHAKLYKEIKIND